MCYGGHAKELNTGQIKFVNFTRISDGYPTQDVIMRWKGNSLDDHVHGVNESEIPQFSIIDHRAVSTIEYLQTGELWLLDFI